MFEPRVTLIPEPDGQFSLFARTPIPNASFSAGRSIKKAPPGIRLGAHIIPIQLGLKYKTLAEPGEPRIVNHRAFNLDLEDGQVVRVFVVLDDRVLGSADVMASADPGTGAMAMVAFDAAEVRTPALRPRLTPALCQAVVVAATPSSGAFTSPSQQLRALGVIDDARAMLHRAGVRDGMRQIGYSIRTTDISSGPAVSVAQSRDSVFANAL